VLRFGRFERDKYPNLPYFESAEFRVDDLANLETQMLRNYFAWAGGNTPSSPMPVDDTPATPAPTKGDKAGGDSKSEDKPADKPADKTPAKAAPTTPAKKPPDKTPAKKKGGK